MIKVRHTFGIDSHLLLPFRLKMLTECALSLIKALDSAGYAGGGEAKERDGTTGEKEIDEVTKESEEAGSNDTAGGSKEQVEQEENGNGSKEPQVEDGNGAATTDEEMPAEAAAAPGGAERGGLLESGCR